MFSTTPVSLSDQHHVDFRRFRELCQGLARVIQLLGFQRIVELFEVGEPRWWIIEMLQDPRLREHPWLKSSLDASATRILGIESRTVPRVFLDSRASVYDWYSMSMTTKSVSVKCTASLELSR